MMANDFKLYQMIRSEFKQESEKEEAFKHICRKRGLNSPSYSTICKWFECLLVANAVLKNEIGDFHYKLLHEISGQYSKFTNAMYYREHADWNYGNSTFIQTRFKFTVGDAINSLVIYDSFNEESSIEEEGDTVIYKGHFLHDRIRIKEEEIEFEAELLDCKLVNDALFAFKCDWNDDENVTWHFTQYDLNSNPARKINELSLPGCQKCAESFYALHAYVWSSNKLYTICKLDRYFSIDVFDADAHSWMKTKFIGLGEVSKLSIDENGLLMIDATENHDIYNKPKITNIYRLPMRKPDKLRFLSWAKIRRGALFFGSELYEKPLPRLPYNLEFRPFSENY